MDPRFAELVGALVRAQTFEDAAECTLRECLFRLEQALASSPYARRGRVLRAMVHLRPSEAYRRLYVLEAPRRNASDAASCAPSATLWRWVSERSLAVSSDVNLGVVQAEGAGAALDEATSRSFDTQQSQAHLLARDATHVLALPLRAPGGELAGMVTLEAECRAAVGQSFVWSECLSALQLATDVAGPYLAALPSRERAASAPDELLPVVGASMTALVEMLRIFSRQEETILLTGPTGVGKSRLARWCHEQSARRGQPFETLDLATVPEELQMAELFGWRKGAFTGALRDTNGAVSRAEGGTLFLDELDKLSLRAQAGVLRVLEERRYRPLGDGAGEKSANVRFLVGTNVSLAEAVREGRFRQDLYYRINVLPLRVPPLSERRDEIAPWAEYMLARRQGESTEGSRHRLSPEAEQVLRRQPWPGNLRQLDNVVRRAYALALLDHGAAPPAPLRAAHLEKALNLEGEEPSRGALEALQRAAEAFVTEAEEQRSRGRLLDLEHAEALKGLVLAAALERSQSREEAFLLLGKENLVQNRNHQRIWRAEMKRLEAALRALEQEAPAPLRRLLAPTEE